MLLGLQQLFTSPKVRNTGDQSAQGTDLEALANAEGMGEFAAELLASFTGLNPQDAQALMAKLPQDMQTELQAQLGEQAQFLGLENLQQNQEVSSLISPDLPSKSSNSLDLAVLVQAAEIDSEVIAETKSVKSLIAGLTQKMTAKSSPAERSPAIDFEPANIDAQLLNFEDFNLQKNAIKKSNPQATYQNLEGKKELDLKSTEMVNAVATDGESRVQNSAQFILNTMIESDSSPNDLKVANSAPVFNASDIKTTDTKVIIDQISDYIMQAKVAKEPTVNMKMTHQDLGHLDITVSKGMNASDAVAINIGASALEGKQFFNQNLKELTAHLANAGIQVSEIKVESTQTKSEFDFNQQQKNADSGQKQFGSEQNQRRHDQEKRQSLWDLLSNQEAA